jgi:uncharacterized protein YuzE
LKFSYHPDTDSLYIEFYPGEDRKAARTVVISDEINVDVDDKGRPVGMDLYQYASKMADLSKLEAEGPIFGLVPAESTKGQAS